MSRKRHKQACQHLAWVERKLELDPGDPMLHLRRAHLLEALGQDEAALRELRQSGRLFMAGRMFRHARSIFQMVLDRRENDIVAESALRAISERIQDEYNPVAEAILHPWESDTPIDLWQLDEAA